MSLWNGGECKPREGWGMGFYCSACMVNNYKVEWNVAEKKCWVYMNGSGLDLKRESQAGRGCYQKGRIACPEFSFSLPSHWRTWRSSALHDRIHWSGRSRGIGINWFSYGRLLYYLMHYDQWYLSVREWAKKASRVSWLILLRQKFALWVECEEVIPVSLQFSLMPREDEGDLEKPCI